MNIPVFQLRCPLDNERNPSIGHYRIDIVGGNFDAFTLTSFIKNHEKCICGQVMGMQMGSIQPKRS